MGVRSPYIFFSMEQRQLMQVDMPIAEKARQACEMWIRLPGRDVEAYQNMSNDDKSRCQRDMALYIEQRRHAGDFKTWRNRMRPATLISYASVRLEKGRASVTFR